MCSRSMQCLAYHQRPTISEWISSLFVSLSFIQRASFHRMYKNTCLMNIICKERKIFVDLCAMQVLDRQKEDYKEISSASNELQCITSLYLVVIPNEAVRSKGGKTMPARKGSLRVLAVTLLFLPQIKTPSVHNDRPSGLAGPGESA